MKKYSIFLFVLVLVMLVGCGNNDTLADQEETNEEQATESEETTAEQGEEESEAEDEGNSSKEPVDALGVIEAATEAMNQVDGLALEGEIEARSVVGGITMMDEIDEIVGEVTFEPYTEHLNYTTKSKLSSVTEKSEAYVVDQKTYALISSAEEGRLVMPLGLDHVGTIITESQYKVFSKHHDQFELSENNGNYVLSFEGSGDIYKEVINGGLRDTIGEEGYQAVTSIVDGISGSFQLTIDKQKMFRVNYRYLYDEIY